MVYLALFWAFVLGLHHLRVHLVDIGHPLAVDVYSMSKALLLCGLLKLTEEMLLFGVNTRETLQKDPVAYAIYVAAFALIIGQSAL